MNKIIVNNPKNVINSKIGKNYFKLVGTGGPKGDKGDKGDTGAAATISAGTASSLPAGSSPTVTNSGTSSAAVFNFGIPKGDKGDKGDTGATGAAATITVGSTTTGAAGTNASVTNTGTSGAAVLNFTIPRGDKGETGATGATGATGQAATIAVGSTTTLTPGSSATVTNSGTSSAATFNFGIPQGVKGDTGSVKSAYVTSLPSTGNEDTYYLNGDTATTGSVSGTAVQITNADNTGEISDFKLNGNTEQTTYSGKNLFNKGNDLTQFTTNANNATITKTASTITIQTTASTSAGFYVLNNAFTSYIDGFNNTKTYTISADITTSANTQIRFGFEGGITQVAVNGKQRVSNTSTSASIGSAFICYAFVNGITVKVENIQIEESASMTPYEPYVGGIASPNPDYPQAVNVVTGEQVVKVEGKNLFDKSAIASGKLIDRNTGALNNNANYATSDFIPVKAGEQYTYTGFNYWYACGFNSAKEWVSLLPNTATITIPDGVKYIRAGLLLTNLDTAQLELGNQATTYEAYRGTDYEVNLGKNLLENTHAIGSTTTNSMTFMTNSDGSITLDGTASALTWYVFHSASLVLPAGTYTLSTGTTTTTTIGVYNDSFGNTTTGSTNTKTFTSPTTGNVSIRVPSGVHVDNLTIKPQIEAGSTATTYAPYFTPIELCKIGTYQDYIWNDNGTWKEHKAVGKVDLGSLTYTGGTVNQGYIYSTTGITGIKYVSSNTELGAIISTDYTLHTASGMWDTHGFIAVDTAKVAITNKTASPTGTAYYALATATDTAITESALITQLDNLVSAELLSGVNNIMLVPANQPDGTMSIDYTTWDKHDRYDVYIWNDTIGDYQLIHAGGGNN